MSTENLKKIAGLFKSVVGSSTSVGKKLGKIVGKKISDANFNDMLDDLKDDLKAEIKIQKDDERKKSLRSLLDAIRKGKFKPAPMPKIPDDPRDNFKQFPRKARGGLAGRLAKRGYGKARK